MDTERFDQRYRTSSDRRHKDTSADQFRKHYYIFLAARYDGREDIRSTVSECQYRHSGYILGQPHYIGYHR